MRKWLNKIQEKFASKVESKEEIEDERVEAGLSIINFTGNKKAFDEVVDMLCEQIEIQIDLKLDKDEITQSFLSDGKTTYVFDFYFSGELPDIVQKSIDLAKKNVQLKIKGEKRYKDIQLIGVKNHYFLEEELPHIWEYIENDEQLRELDAPLMLHLQLVYYTCVYDFDRYVKFAAALDKRLKLPKVDLRDVKLRVKDAVSELTLELQKSIDEGGEEGITDAKTIIKHYGEQGGVKLVYLRNYGWDLEEIKKNPELLNLLQDLLEFMQDTMNSEAIEKDYIVSKFWISNGLATRAPHGCYATIDENSTLSNEILEWKLPQVRKNVLD